MKKLFFLLASVCCFCVAEAQHLEFEWRGLYVVGGYSYSMNLSTQEGQNTASFHNFGASVGFQFRKEAGVGLGLDYMMDPTGAFTQMPIYLELRSHYLRSRLTPFSVLQLGYALPLGTSSTGDNAIHVKEGGLTFGLQAGARYAFTRNFGVSLFVGYQLVMLNQVEYNIDGGLALREPALLNNLKFGLAFNF